MPRDDHFVQGNSRLAPGISGPQTFQSPDILGPGVELKLTFKRQPDNGCRQGNLGGHAVCAQIDEKGNWPAPSCSSANFVSS